METYPGELLVGVFPLVFCVDATITKVVEKNNNTDDDDRNSSSNSHSRSQFDRFLDAMASSLLEDPNTESSNTATPSKDVMMALLRPNASLGDYYDSEDDDELISHTPSSSSRKGKGDFITFDQSILDDMNRRPRFDPASAHTPPAARRSFGIGRKNAGRNSTPNNTYSSGGSYNNNGQHNLDTSYAQALQNGQGFFQRARIVSISSRHGFPPSKDPSGEKNRVFQFTQQQGGGAAVAKLVSVVKSRPIDGILPSGWLEKHVHALPSVILVVAQVAQDQTQFSQDERLMQTLENLQYSLAPKRRCSVQVVGLVQEGVNRGLAEQWAQTISDKLDDGVGQGVMLLNVADLQQDVTPSIALQQLHTFTRQASFQYYSTQLHRTKQKLGKLGQARLTPLLLPLSIRYCFKIAMLYEFQWKHEKSVKFMVEAYRNIETYYRFLLQQREHKEDGNSNAQQQQATEQNKTSSSTSLVDKISFDEATQSTAAEDNRSSEGDEGVELSLPQQGSMNDDEISFLKSAPVPEDMVYQCRKIADWLNFKILQSGLVSHTEGGLIVASKQWQKHLQAFCSPRRSFVFKPNSYNSWIDWSYVAHQRMVVSQLLERHPPKSLGNLGMESEEALLRCSPWRTYEATAEAILRLGAEINRTATNSSGKIQKENNAEKKKDNMRRRYVGDLDADGHLPKLQEESKINHREKALECINRSLSLFEREAEKARKDPAFISSSWSRSASRLQYLAGSTLLGMGRHEEAVPFLTKASKLCKGWSGLEVAVRRMLIECYEKHIPLQTEENSQNLISLLLDSYFHARISNSNLRSALGKFSAFSGGGSVKWYRDCIDEADGTLPFSFFFSFPSLTHAIAGDKVKATLVIKSNLEYAVHVNSVTLLTLAGPVTIPSNDLLSAKNADEGSDGGIIIQARSEILLSTEIQLPKDLNEIAIDESGNGGEKEGTAGKGSFSKSARPRSGGLTSGAGARLVSEELNGDMESRGGKSQWSLKCLGGKPLRCDGLRLLFHPVHSAAVNEGENTIVELTIEKKSTRTETNIKRTPFEEDNYIASAWKRPQHIPLTSGPRCLRVLSPMADMIVTNLTEPYTNGKVLEGTVNRVLLRLKAGLLENCLDVKFKVNSSSFLVSAQGKTRRLVDVDQIQDSDDSGKQVSKENPRARTPILVTRDDSAKGQTTVFGYNIPAGWTVVDEKQESSDQSYVPIVSTLTSGESTYAYFDVYRPLPFITRMDGVLQAGENKEDSEFDQDVCQTDIEVSISYRQERPTAKSKVPIRRRTRKKPGEDIQHEQAEEEEKSDLVNLDHSTRILWVSPISAVFSPGLKDTHPCGNRHPSNNLPDTGNVKTYDALTQTEMVILDGERVSTKCTLEAAASVDGLGADIDEIRFKDNGNGQEACDLKLLSGKNDEGLLYKADNEDPCRSLTIGSKFSLAWMTEVKMKSNFLKGSLSSTLGMISVDWRPASIALPEEVSGSESISEHGPLQLATPSTCCFMGPPCYIENAPFEVKIDTLPYAPKLSVPFAATYRIRNKTTLHQTLRVVFNDKEFPDNQSSGLLISGLVDGKLSLGPSEVFNLSYTLIPTRTGKIWMPQICVSSDRYNTWVIKESPQDRKMVLILP